MKIIPVLIIAYCCVMLSCQNEKNKALNTNIPEKIIVQENTLTAEELADGWQLLFNGKTLDGWNNYASDTIGKAWTIEDNTLHLKVESTKEWQTKNGGDIVYNALFDNFHLKLDWRISKNGNSGIVFYVNEDAEKYQYPWMTGPEMQILDNDGHPDANIIKHRAGDLYDLITAKETSKPALEWNHAEIIANNGQLQFFLNNEKILETTMWNKSWQHTIDTSKFVNFPDFGTYKQGKICLQDHGDKVWFKNIKIKKL